MPAALARISTRVSQRIRWAASWYSPFEKFTVNSRRPPHRIFLSHLPNDSSNLGLDSRPAKTLCPRSDSPKRTRSGSMPGDYGFRLNNGQGIGPSGPKLAEQNPKHAISHPQSRARMFPLKYAQLLTQGNDLEAEVVTGTEEGTEKGEESLEKWNHDPGFIACAATTVSALAY